MADGAARERRAGPPAPRAVVVMGVAGCGKSAVAAALAAALDWRFVEGDRLHPPENIARMASGRPLTDDDRKGWLDAVGDALAAVRAEGGGVVAACSALKRRYRDRLRRRCPDILFLHLVVDPETARRRVGSRVGHFMPPSLVASQFADLEPPAADEPAFALDGERPLADTVAAARTLLPPLRTGA